LNPSDAELIARVIATDDRAAFGELVRRHQSAVRRFLRHLASGDAALADDLAQETFVQAYRGLARFRGEASFASWLLGIAHNHWRNARRKNRATEGVTDRHESSAEEAPSPAQAVALSHDLAHALRELSPDEQTAVHLCFQQGLSHREAASVLDWPLGTVKTHLARGKDKLRHLLAAWNPQI
jgi:RNA polymerase sigma-70 factor (ECF subfamily)